MSEHSKHEKARALAVEFLNDWETIFMVLRHPHLPLTNPSTSSGHRNEAERALRHWVIMRKTCAESCAELVEVLSKYLSRYPFGRRYPRVCAIGIGD